ncbi:MAG: alpha-L-fucosidase [Kiritimatiellia bacterium]
MRPPAAATRRAGAATSSTSPTRTKDFSKYFERKVKPQVRELLTQYGPIGVMWFDTPELITKAQSQELLTMIRSIQPDCIVNVRIGNGLGDFGTPEQEIPSAVSAKPWETCMTMNGKWGWNKFDKNWKTPETLLRNLVDIVSKGGNYLLNVGPTGEGTFPPESIERLAIIGKWMKVNGEAVYGCGPTPFGAELGALHPTEKDAKGHPKFVPAWDWRCTTKPGAALHHRVHLAGRAAGARRRQGPGRQGHPARRPRPRPPRRKPGRPPRLHLPSRHRPGFHGLGCLCRG